MIYYLVDKNQNDGVLAHAGDSKSKYAGGFTKDGKNTKEYNADYYSKNKDKWKEYRKKAKSALQEGAEAIFHPKKHARKKTIQNNRAAANAKYGAKAEQIYLNEAERNPAKDLRRAAQRKARANAERKQGRKAESIYLDQAERNPTKDLFRYNAEQNKKARANAKHGSKYDKAEQIYLNEAERDPAKELRAYKLEQKKRQRDARKAREAFENGTSSVQTTFKLDLDGVKLERTDEEIREEAERLNRKLDHHGTFQFSPEQKAEVMAGQVPSKPLSRKRHEHRYVMEYDDTGTGSWTERPTHATAAVRTDEKGNKVEMNDNGRYDILKGLNPKQVRMLYDLDNKIRDYAFEQRKNYAVNYYLQPLDEGEHPDASHLNYDPWDYAPYWAMENLGMSWQAANSIDWNAVAHQIGEKNRKRSRRKKTGVPKATR